MTTPKPLARPRVKRAARFIRSMTPEHKAAYLKWLGVPEKQDSLKAGANVQASADCPVPSTLICGCSSIEEHLSAVEAVELQSRAFAKATTLEAQRQAGRDAPEIGGVHREKLDAAYHWRELELRGN